MVHMQLARLNAKNRKEFDPFAHAWYATARTVNTCAMNTLGLQPRPI